MLKNLKYLIYKIFHNRNPLYKNLVKEIRKEINKCQKLLLEDPENPKIKKAIKELKKALKNPMKVAFSNKAEMEYNIYEEPGTTKGEHQKKHHIIHWIIKEKIIYPIWLIFEGFFKKYLVDKIPDRVENRNLILFDIAWEMTEHEWAANYLSNNGSMGFHSLSKEKQEEKIKGHLNNTSLRMLRAGWKMVKTMCINDYAYKEFFNFLMYNIAIVMNRFYCNDPIVRHLIYSDKGIYDKEYFVIDRTIAGASLNKVPKPPWIREYSRKDVLTMYHKNLSNEELYEDKKVDPKQ